MDAAALGPKEAIRVAKDWIRDIYADESLSNVGLEELKIDEVTNDWLITIGFSRPWDRDAVSYLSEDAPASHRSYKIVRISPEGLVRSVEERVFAT